MRVEVEQLYRLVQQSLPVSYGCATIEERYFREMFYEADVSLFVHKIVSTEE